MQSLLDQQASKVILGQSGQEGTKGIFPVDDDKIVTSTNMKNGAYTIAAQPIAPCLLSVLVTAGDTPDTMGTITFVGTDINDTAITEVVTPIAGTTVYTTQEFKTVTSATGADWVIDGAETTNDTVKIGVSSVIAPTGYYISAIQILATTVVASQTAKSGFLVAELSDFTGLPVGIYPTKLTKVAFTSGEGIAYLTREY